MQDNNKHLLKSILCAGSLTLLACYVIITSHKPEEYPACTHPLPLGAWATYRNTGEMVRIISHDVHILCYDGTDDLKRIPSKYDIRFGDGAIIFVPTEDVD